MRKLFAALLAVFIATSTSTAFSVDATSSPSPSTVAIAATSLETGNFVVGDTGPGGGLIFYINSKGFSCGPTFSKTGSPEGGLCHYLEVAPSGWKSGKSGDLDPRYFWSVKSKMKADVVGMPDIVISSEKFKIANFGIGLGYKNSVAIVNQGNDANTSAGASRAYMGGMKSDWYLPSLAEANELCKWARGVPSKSVETVCGGGKLNSPTYGAGSVGLIQSSYATSSESIDTRLPKKYRHENIWLLQIYDGNNPHYLTPDCKCNNAYTRPIRAF